MAIPVSRAPGGRRHPLRAAAPLPPPPRATLVSDPAPGYVGRVKTPAATWLWLPLVQVWLSAFALAAPAPGPVLKEHSAFFPPERLARIRQNLARHPEGERLRRQALERAAWWREQSDDTLWSLMFGPSISRSWMVWSNGDCPSCKRGVPMYTWEINARQHPWKVRCPHCREFFPKNDFGAYYRSGLNREGLFDPARADRTLLFNAEHPGPNDPLRGFGVDDGEGYVAGDRRWRFIGAYLVYGQFKQLIRDGIQALATAWVLTGDPACARKAGILLDRVADVYPSFDYAAQGYVYERRQPAGYVSVWHDACEETREMVLAYDQVFEGIRHDPALPAFLSAKATAHGLANPKTSFADIQRNIEDRILRDALQSPAKMHSNFPRREIAYTIIHCVLGWPGNRTEVENDLERFVRPATAVDGVTGEKGLAGYAAYTISGLASLLARLADSDPQFLGRLFERVPTLRQTWRFHIDTLCLDQFYPNSGDCGAFAQPAPRYVGASFTRLDQPRLEPSLFTFFWQLYQTTGDPAYVQILHRENGDTLEGLPHDLMAPDPEALRRGVADVIARQGPRPQLSSVHKSRWHLGILRSGTGGGGRALWLDYDSGGAHGHADLMTLGLFARGRDLLPDFGYPPVQHGGWSTPEVAWYLSPAAHNTVVVDGRSPAAGAGDCTLWADGVQIHLMRASAPRLAGVSRFERTALLVDISPEDFYVADLFRVAGGRDHAKFVHGPRGQMKTSGLETEPVEPFGHGALMRNFRQDARPSPGWSATWTLEPAAAGRTPLVMRYRDFSTGAQAATAEARIMPYIGLEHGEFWNPALMIRRQGTLPLQSAFLSTLEVFEAESLVRQARRLEVRHDAGGVCTNGCVALEITLADGRTDLLLAADEPHAGVELRFAELVPSLAFAGEICLARMGIDGALQRLALCRAQSFRRDDWRIVADPAADLLEISFAGPSATLESGSPGHLRELRHLGKAVTPILPARSPAAP